MTEESKPFVLKSVAAAGPKPEQAGEPAEASPPLPMPPPPTASMRKPARQGGTDELNDLGASLSGGMLEKGYQPVVLFGTNNSGKTSLLLSLFASILSDTSLETGLFLADAILPTRKGVGAQLSEDARYTFEVNTQRFIEGERIEKTNVSLPFFVPVEFRPTGKAPVTFAFLESNGEWYRPDRETGTYFPKLRTEIETFISTYQGGIIFIYLVPYTQARLYTQDDQTDDQQEVTDASLAIAGVLRAYDRCRATNRGNDRHLMLVSKWDAASQTSLDRAADLEPERAEVEAFCVRRYGQALATFRGLQLGPDQLSLNAYCAGLISDRGRLHLRPEDEIRAVIQRYPLRLWTWLYRSALQNADLPAADPFPAPPQPPAIVRFVRGLLDRLIG